VPTSSDEYNSLREELLEHQRSRMPVLSLALTASVTLFAASVSTRFGSPYLPLFALLLLSAARVQIIQIQYGVQRIASYIRVVLENDGASPDLRWETASYRIRHASASKRKLRRIWNIFPLTPIDWTLFCISLAAIALAIAISLNQMAGAAPVPIPLPRSFYVSAAVAVAWSGFWLYCNRKAAELHSMKVDENEAEFWRSNFRSVQLDPPPSAQVGHDSASLTPRLLFGVAIGLILTSLVLSKRPRTNGVRTSS
jgi:hypothetical protein